MSDRVMSRDLTPGTRVRRRGTSTVEVLDRRKDPAEHTGKAPFWPGWWLAGNSGGLADIVIDNPDTGWEVVDTAPRFEDQAAVLGLRFWGSDCTECGNATAGTMCCDDCGSTLHTVALWIGPQAHNDHFGTQP